MGQLYRYLPNRGHGLIWHTDFNKNRRIAVSLNLSTAAFSGGAFELGVKKTGRPLASVTNTDPGCAILFPIRDSLEHRLLKITGRTPRTTYVGWFCKRPNFLKSARHVFATRKGTAKRRRHASTR